MKNFESMRTNSNRDFLESSVPLVNGWSWQRLLQLAEMLELKGTPAGSTIAKQGDPAEKMYLYEKELYLLCVQLNMSNQINGQIQNIVRKL